ncbi:MAG: NAD-dependent epimerase/dehydratase family protein [Ignavibacteriae bacterium]|nr:NAD-dependent epimerase/dehydratase family protein [Ignavibacteriota bacterium]
MSVLVTGGTGFIGQHVVRMLAERSETVHVLQRQRGKYGGDSAPNIKTFYGDILDRESILNALRGCNKIIHLAAFARVWAKDPTIFHQINVLGTRNVLDAALKAGIEKVVYTSSCAAVRLSGGGILDENSFREPDHFLTEYARSKFLAEKEVLSYMEKGLRIVTVYPTRVYGPGKMTDGNAATKAIALYLKGRLPLMLESGEEMANWTFVEDVAHGHVAALDKGDVAERYILGGHNITLKNVFHRINLITQKKHLQLSLPKRLAYAIASFEELKAKLFGIKLSSTLI